MSKPSSLILRQCSLFSLLDSKGLSKISSVSTRRQYSKNEMIFQEGETARGFFLVLRGKVKVYKLSAAGQEHILHIVTDGDSFAEAVVFGNLKQFPAYAQTLAASDLLFVRRDDFLSLMKADFTLTLSVLRSLTGKLKYFNRLIEELSLKEADARLAKYLLDLSLKKKSQVFCLDLKKTELARRLGISPETLSRIFQRFRTKGLIRLKKTEVRLLSQDNLSLVCAGEKI